MDVHRRRYLVAAVAATVASSLAAGARAAPAQPVTVYKNVACGCCGGWIEHMRANGFEVRVHDVADVTPHKQRLGVPMDLASCHTAEVGGYAIEGHVPAADVRRLLSERPAAARGLAVPGMVLGSPGMDGPRTAYATLVFDANGRSRPYARH
ncbi:MAG: DUF411 domain-containing protein [Burkholderiales bacterium]